MRFTNNTDKIIRIVWEKSSLSYNGGTYVPFVTGQKYINAGEPLAPSVIPAHGYMEKDVFSSGQVYYVSGQYGGWSMRNITASSVTIVICVESADLEDYYTVDVYLTN